MKQQSLIANIQLLRFIAATLVMLFHAASQLGDPLQITSTFWQGFRLIGFAGVDIFFVISGFIIYQGNQPFASTNIAAHFLCRRLARIFLGYWPFLLLATVICYFTDIEKFSSLAIAQSFFLIPVKLKQNPLPVNWTLSLEIYFYILFAIASLNKARLALLLAFSTGIVVLNFWLAYDIKAYTWKGFHAIPAEIRLLISPWVIEFCAGCLVARFIENGYVRHAKLALIAGSILFTAGWPLNHYFFNGKLELFYNYAYRIPFFTVAGASLVYGLAGLETSGTRLLPRVGILLGGASYALYLLHMPLFDLLSSLSWLSSDTGVVTPVVKYLLILTVTVTGAVLIYLAIEKPVYRSACLVIDRLFAASLARKMPR